MAAVPTVWGPKVIAVEDSVTAAVTPETVPVPERETLGYDCPGAIISRLSVRSPDWVGLNVMFTVQLAPGASWLGQLSSSEKSLVPSENEIGAVSVP